MSEIYEVLLKMQGVTETPALNFDVWCLQTLPIWSLSNRSSSGQQGESALPLCPSHPLISEDEEEVAGWAGGWVGARRREGGGNV